MGSLFASVADRPHAPTPPCVGITAAERAQLIRWVRARTSPQRLVVRSRIVLLASDGLGITGIAERLHVTPATVRLWCDRFSRVGLAALGREAPGRGRPRGMSPDVVVAVLAMMRERPTDAALWTTRSLGARAGVSASTVWRVWKQFDLGPASTTHAVTRVLAQVISDGGDAPK